ncbi:hypothetical protein DSECCO2_82470 [anaerobic digester metagenome]
MSRDIIFPYQMTFIHALEDSNEVSKNSLVAQVFSGVQRIQNIFMPASIIKGLNIDPKIFHPSSHMEESRKGPPHATQEFRVVFHKV